MKVLNAFNELYDEYVKYLVVRNVKICIGSSLLPIKSSTSLSRKSIPYGLSRSDQYLNFAETVTPTKVELDIYFENGISRCKIEEVACFDALEGWK